MRTQWIAFYADRNNSSYSNFMLKGKSKNYTNLFSPDEYEKNYNEEIFSIN